MEKPFCANWCWKCSAPVEKTVPHSVVADVSGRSQQASPMASSGALSATARSENSSCSSSYRGNCCGEEICLKLLPPPQGWFVFPFPIISLCPTAYASLPVFAFFLLLTVNVANLFLS